MKSYVYNLKNINDTIGISFVVRCGSMNEMDNQRGFSHLLEHMLISFDKFNYNPEISCSGYTDFYYTCFSFFTTKKHMTTCIEYVRQIINGKFIRSDILENIRKDVLEEYFSFCAKGSKTEYQWLLQGTKYINQLAIGDLEIIKKCTIEQLKEYYFQNYISEKFELIVMGDISNTKNGMYFCDGKEIDNIWHRYCVNDFEWINYGKGQGLKIYYVKCVGTGDDFIYDYLFCTIVENFISEYYDDDHVEVTKILLSGIEEFFCICLSSKYLKTLNDLRVLIDKIYESVDKDYVKKFLKEYKKIYEKYLKNGYGINVVNEMKFCVKYLIFKDRLMGTQEMNNFILNKTANIEIDKILRMINHMKTNDDNFYLYKILEI